jgi:chemotaxis protein CheX
MFARKARRPDRRKYGAGRGFANGAALLPTYSHQVRGTGRGPSRGVVMKSTIAVANKTDLFALTQAVWSSMANITLSPTNESPDKTHGYVVAAVQVVGPWQGAVRLDMDLNLAQATTANLLMVDKSEVSREDLKDASGELANMTGGSFKTLLEAEYSVACNLSLPSVAIGSNYELFIPRATVIAEAFFSSEFGRLGVTIIESEAAPLPGMCGA